MKQSESCRQMRALVSGQVQGVGFRLWAQRRARALGLTGFVHNVDDGSVEVVCEGPQAALEQYLMALRRGPESAEVRAVQAHWASCAGVSDRFEIRR
jgi:acylphosphatase